MRRRLGNVFTSLAPLPVALILAMWWRSYRVSDLVAFQPARERYSLWSESGEVCFRGVQNTHGTLEPWRHESAAVGQWGRYVPPQSNRRVAGGFCWERNVLSPAGGAPKRYVAVVAPYWAVSVASATPVAWAAARLVRGRRRGRCGCCRSCGYDLRATPGRCPECGTAVVTII